MQDIQQTAQHHIRTYFAAANGAEGFTNYYGDCFGDASGVQQLYIVKGGPGTGKSHFMREVSHYATAQGWTAVHYFCSSDPASLDGVRLTSPGGQTIGLIDGTSPHAWEPSLPGARENLVDLGQYWDAPALASQREAIQRLGSQKSAAYSRAYHYLRAAGEADKVIDSLTDALVDHARLEALAMRILRNQENAEEPEGLVWPGGYLCTGPTAVPALRHAIGMTGQVRLDSFDREASRLLCVGDRLGLGYRLLGHLRTESLRRGLPVMISYDPVRRDKVDGLFWPKSRLCVLNDTVDACEESYAPRALSLRRYADSAGLKDARTSLREATAIREHSIQSACHALADAAKAHFSLEELYTAAMDFPAKEAFTAAFCQRVL